jgi:hypothetical protein
VHGGFVARDPVNESTGSAADTASSSFLDAWLEAWPEWPIAQVFVEPRRRDTVLAWGALQQELLEAAWGGSDARPGEAKLAWWAEELQGWPRGRRRHPLGRVLQREPAPWAALAAALPALGRTRERPLDMDDAYASLAPAAAEAARIDAAVAGGAQPGTATVVASWLAWRVLRHGESAVPSSVLAEAGQGDAVLHWRKALLQRWPSDPRAARIRRLWCALARVRLATAPGQVPPFWRVLPAAWRAARN